MSTTRPGARSRESSGPISILVNNAGFQHVAPIETFPEDVFDDIVRTMLTAPFLLIKGVWSDMRERGWGRIVNIGSVHSSVASPNKSAYVAAKHGALGLARVAATRHLAIHGVHNKRLRAQFPRAGPNSSRAGQRPTPARNRLL